MKKLENRSGSSKDDTDKKEDINMRPVEPPDVEPEDQLKGARANDINKWQIEDTRKWLDEDQKRMADAKQDFDKKLMDVTGKITVAQDLLSGRIFDALIGGHLARERNWKQFDLKPNNLH
eukprot:12793937-Heterocapsa_arctica.AAC.1